MNVQAYAIAQEFARYIESANPALCLRAADDFTTYACDPASQPLREAFAACWPSLTQQRMCLDYLRGTLDFIETPAHGTGANASSVELNMSTPAKKKKAEEDAMVLAWLRDNLDNARQSATPWETVTE